MNHLQQELQYTVLYPTGEEDVVSTLDIFLDRLLNHLPAREPPPLEVLNKLLTLENLDYGMSGGLRWPSFSLANNVYKEFLKIHNKHVMTDFPLDTDDMDEWRAWCFHKHYGVPFEKQLFYLNKIKNLTTKLESAQKERLKPEAAKLKHELEETEKEHLDFLHESGERYRQGL